MTLTPIPNAPPPDDLDELLARHLTAQLDSQRGRALAAFRRAHAHPSSSTDGNPRPMSRHSLWLWAGVPSALAAGLAVVVTLQFLAAHPNKVVPASTGNPVVAGASNDPGAIVFDSPVLDRVELTRDVDGGITRLDDETPVRMIRHQTLRRDQWIDPKDNATFTITQPIERVDYVKLQPY